MKTDQKRLQQILLNLVSNAIKFTDRNGKIMILVELISKNNGDSDHDKLRISVIDSGIGILKEDQDKLF